MISVSDFHAFEHITEYLAGVPYDTTPRALYTPETLYNGGHDAAVYAHFLATGKHSCSEEEMLARALHDYGMDRALKAFLDRHDPMRMVGVMGGHGLPRTDTMFREIVRLSKRLTEQGALMVTGGGPGAMEATHLGAWLAGQRDAAVDEALATMAAAPSFGTDEWLDTAFSVRRRYPQHRYHSLGIPTWLYGHEPTTPFATDIAKYFDNSIREDTILTIAYGGIIFTPGSAGTMQEIFQEAVQNHYLTFGISSPMVFLGRQFWTDDIPVFPFLEKLVSDGKYKNLRLTLTDSATEAIEALHLAPQEPEAATDNA